MRYISALMRNWKKCAVLSAYFPVNQVLENGFGAQLDVNWAKNTWKSLKNKYLCAKIQQWSTRTMLFMEF